MRTLVKSENIRSAIIHSISTLPRENSIKIAFSENFCSLKMQSENSYLKIYTCSFYCYAVCILWFKWFEDTCYKGYKVQGAGKDRVKLLVKNDVNILAILSILVFHKMMKCILLWILTLGILSPWVGCVLCRVCS